MSDKQRDNDLIARGRELAPPGIPLSNEVETELLPCAHCGGEPWLASYAEGHGTTYRVECDCDVQGLQQSAIDAISLWQARVSTSADIRTQAQRAAKRIVDMYIGHGGDDETKIATIIEAEFSHSPERVQGVEK